MHMHDGLRSPNQIALENELECLANRLAVFAEVPPGPPRIQNAHHVNVPRDGNIGNLFYREFNAFLLLSLVSLFFWTLLYSRLL